MEGQDNSQAHDSDLEAAFDAEFGSGWGEEEADEALEAGGEDPSLLNDQVEGAQPEEEQEGQGVELDAGSKEANTSAVSGNVAGVLGRAEAAGKYPSHYSHSQSDEDLDLIAEQMMDDWEVGDFQQQTVNATTRQAPTATSPQPAPLQRAGQQAGGTQAALAAPAWDEELEPASNTARQDSDAGPSKRRRIISGLTGSRTAASSGRAGHGQQGDSVPAGQGVPEQQQCPHPSFWAGLCVQCGMAKPEEGDVGWSNGGAASSAGGAPGVGGGATRGRDAGATDNGMGVTTRIKHLHDKGHMEVSAEEGHRLRKLEVSRLLNSRKLVLILDLDHTLLNSVRLNEVDTNQTTKLDAILKREDSLGQQRLLHCLRSKNLWTKLRPGVYSMLESLRSLYEMHIYTMGDKHYAQEIRRLLDPQKRLFASAISACDSTSRASKDLDVALADDRLVVILDDTEQVWPRHKRNLLQVDRYFYFPDSLRKSRDPNHKSMLDMDRDESAADGMMATCSRVLKDVHTSFFSQGGVLPIHQRDVRYYLARRKQDVLQGCVVVFSRCWPQAYTTPYQHPLWLLAESLGAECSLNYDPEVTTHVVAAAAGATAKVAQAQADGKYVVLPNWLHACMFRWCRVPEEQFIPGSNHMSVQEAAVIESVEAKEARDKEELSLVLKAAGGGTGEQA